MAVFPAYAPEFRLRINGGELPAAVRSTVTSGRYQDGRNAADRVEVGFANPDLRWLQTPIKGLGSQPFPTGVRIGPSRAASAAPRCSILWTASRNAAAGTSETGCDPIEGKMSVSRRLRT